MNGSPPRADRILVVRRGQAVDRHPQLGQTLIQAWSLVNCKRWEPAAVTDSTYDVFIDARGLACPMPLIRTRQALMVVEPGATICILATDPTPERDFEMFVEATGHKLLRREKQDDVFLYVLEKAEASELI
jgi:tRNA 2-thiouridine synthesizing protein A